MTITVGVLSDTHLRTVTRELVDIYDRYLSDKDLVLHCGDVVSKEILDMLGRKDFHGVCGNMDTPEVRELLPEKRTLRIGNFNLGLIHGYGSPDGLEDRIKGEFGKVDIIVYGHSHNASNHVREGVLFFNPGSATGYSRSGRNSIGVLEIGTSIDGRIIEI